MRRIALLSLTMLVGGCGYNTWWNLPFSTGSNPNRPVSDSVNMNRVLGQDVAVKPLTPEPGDIWPGPLPPPRTLQDLERQMPSASGATRPVRGSPLDRARNPLLAPLPNGTTPGAAKGGYAIPSDRSTPPADRRIIVPNGNGTSTVIHPDGRIETIPTPQ
jgi:hypothetical protein